MVAKSAGTICRTTGITSYSYQNSAKSIQYIRCCRKKIRKIKTLLWKDPELSWSLHYVQNKIYIKLRVPSLAAPDSEIMTLYLKIWEDSSLKLKTMISLNVDCNDGNPCNSVSCKGNHTVVLWWASLCHCTHHIASQSLLNHHFACICIDLRSSP